MHEQIVLTGPNKKSTGKVKWYFKSCEKKRITTFLLSWEIVMVLNVYVSWQNTKLILLYEIFISFPLMWIKVFLSCLLPFILGFLLPGFTTSGQLCLSNHAFSVRMKLIYWCVASITSDQAELMNKDIPVTIMRHFRRV